MRASVRNKNEGSFLQQQILIRKKTMQPPSHITFFFGTRKGPGTTTQHFVLNNYEKFFVLSI